MRSPWAGCLAVAFAAWAGDAHAQYPDAAGPVTPDAYGTPGAYGAPGGYGPPGDYGAPGAYGPPGGGDVPGPPSFGVVPGPNLACQPTPAMTQGQECVPLLDIRRYYVSADYLLWWFKDARIPVLVTTGNSDPSLTNSGAVGAPGTANLIGGGPVSSQGHSGVSATAGYWCDSDLTFGFEGNYFFAGHNQKTYRVGSDGSVGSLNIYRPYFDVDVGAEQADIIAESILDAPFKAGNVVVSYGGRLAGGEIDFIASPHALERDWFVLKGLAGFRVVALDESLNISSFSSDLVTGGGFDTSVAESFTTHNTFYGGQVGAQARFHGPWWFVDLKAKVAVGNNHEVVNINGAVSQVDQTSGAVATGPGGILTQPSNIGRYHREYLAVVPEGALTFGVQFTKGLSAHVAYNFLYMSQTVRPANVLDRSASIQTLGGGSTGLANRPVFTFNQSEFWAQGLTVGFEFRF